MISMKSVSASCGVSLPPDRQGCYLYRVEIHGAVKYIHHDTEGAVPLQLGGDGRVLACGQCPIHNSKEV